MWCRLCDRCAVIPPRPPPEKRYGWWRKYKGFWDHPKWAVVALHAEVPALVAGAIADKLCECASKSVPQGRLDD